MRMKDGQSSCRRIAWQLSKINAAARTAAQMLKLRRKFCEPKVARICNLSAWEVVRMAGCRATASQPTPTGLYQARGRALNAHCRDSQATAEDGLEAQIIEAANEVIVHNGTAALTRSSIAKVFSKLIRTHQAARERELREKLEGLAVFAIDSGDSNSHTRTREGDEFAGRIECRHFAPSSHPTGPRSPRSADAGERRVNPFIPRAAKESYDERSSAE